jgi:predicted phage terminase large subunit-like protein
LGRAPGQALCPDRYDEETLHGIRRKLGAYSFAALYQQRPIPHEGALFKRKWFKQIIAKAPSGMKWARGYDLAVSTRTSADYTASFRCAIDNDGNLFIADGFRKRIEYPEQRRYVVERMTTEKQTEHGIEKALHGQAFVQDLRQIPQVRGVPFKAVKVDADKYTRALAWANLAEEGKVYLVQGAWIDDFLDEVCRFTGRGDAHDDQVDAVSLAVGMLRRRGGKSMGF